VLHFGYGAWVIVDSCIDVRSRTPVALAYLAEIHIDLASDVRLVVATHWHDDHIRGLAEVVVACKKARFVMSAALRSDEFTTLVALVEPRMAQRSSGVRELAHLYAYLREQGTSPTWAVADRRLWRPAGATGRSIWSLSPSDRSVQMALEAVAAVMSDRSLPNRRVPDVRPNHASVVLWCEMSKTFILLGADLEEVADERAGWKAVVASAERPAEKVHVFKIPHHGSANAHSDDVWQEMIQATAIAVVTPFEHGKTRLPTSSDRRRIRDRADVALITQTAPAGMTAWPPAVQATLAQATSNVREAEPPPGHVRLRRPLNGGAWTIETFGGAGPL
jgi:hypothetical protein